MQFIRLEDDWPNVIGTEDREVVEQVLDNTGLNQQEIEELLQQSGEQ